jgi:carbon monoxide dehydrogenase subunit G
MNLTFYLHKPIDIVFGYLTKMQKFASIHPVISKIDQLPNGGYLVHETLRIGFIPISFTYPVTIRHNIANKTIQMQATVMRLTKIEMSYTLTGNGNQTTVHETISIQSPLPIKTIMEQIFRKQHGLLFENMEALEPGNSSVRA